MTAGPEICGCCAGTDAETPARIDNPPGQSAIAYRVGTHAQFKESLLARLSSTALPALAPLGTRDDTDFTIALCDALAVTLDVLAFYQERIANENFLRTAVERRSILELARLIGYELAPGVAASTYLAFTLQESPGAPAAAALPVTIPVGTRVQSVPGPGEDPQSFETVAEADARVEWNAIPVQTTQPWHPVFGDRSLYLAGVATQLQPGDALLIVGEERRGDPASARWDIRVVTAVEPEAAAQRTRVSWANGLGTASPFSLPAAAGATVYAFRSRAALFGHGAPDPRLMTIVAGSPLEDLTEGSGIGLTWADFEIHESEIDLDAAYPKVVPESWIALVSNDATPHPSGFRGGVALCKATAVSFPSRTDYGLSGKVTRITPDTDEAALDPFRDRIRENLVLAQSEALAVAATPLAYPLYGGTLALGRIVEGLAPGQALAVSGKRARIRLRRGQPDATLQLASGDTAILHEGSSLRLAGVPEVKFGSAWLALPPVLFGLLVAKALGMLRLTLLDPRGEQGTLTIAAAAIEHAPAEDADETVSEIAFVGTLPDAVTPGPERTSLALSAALTHCYDRPTVRANANVAPASHGETVNEILGSADARVPNATFVLKQLPVTYVSAATPSGRASTLTLRANDLAWQEVPSLYARGPTERVYETSIDDAGRTAVRFGDGIEGARPPSGDHNIRATYRKGLGLGGNVAAGRLTSLLSRPLGVTGATNPVPATGGEDAETTDKARTNAPLTVLTLERAVSIRDYRDFARAFAGIAKAHALWVPAGPGRGVFVTVAGERGAAVPETSDTYRNLLDALRAYGDALVPLALANYVDARFRTRVAIKVAADADDAVVLPAVEARLREAFGFDARQFGQGVSVDEVSAIAQAVTGVEAVHVAGLHRVDTPLPDLAPRLFAALPIASLTARPAAAELLTLDAGPLTLDLLP
jgi:hypothetical protein